MTYQCGQSDVTYQLRWLTGTKQIKRTKYHIEEMRIARWWWGYRTEYVIVAVDFLKLSGFKTRDEAHTAARAYGFEWTGGL